MPLQFFRSTDSSAPTLSGVAGSLTSLLDACLVDGYTTASVSGITRSGSTATATLAVANATLVTGDYVKFAGADQGDYNVTAQITVVNSTTVTYAVSNSPATPATGTITYRKAAAGWDIAFTGTNKRAYRSPNSASNRFYCRVDDSTTVGNVREAKARGYEAMTDIDTGTGPFPTTGQMTDGLNWNKSTLADSTTRPWTLVADDKTFYFVPQVAGTIVGHVLAPVLGFGHFVSYKPSDGFNTFIGGTNLSAYSGSAASGNGSGLQLPQNWTDTSSTKYLFVARGYPQTGGSIQATIFDSKTYGATTTVTGAIGASIYGPPYPNGPDSGLWVGPVFIVEYISSAMHVRGRLPGFWSHMHNSVPQSNYDKVTGVVGLSGVTLTAVTVPHYAFSTPVTAVGQIHFDITGPW